MDTRHYPKGRVWLEGEPLRGVDGCKISKGSMGVADIGQSS
jgi:hypothetical protein